MAKRIQAQKGEERSVEKSKLTAVNLSSFIPTSSSSSKKSDCIQKSFSAKIPIASKSPGILIASGKPESRTRINSKSDAASSSQVRLQDAYFGGLMDTAMAKLVVTNEVSGDVDFSESETWSQEEEVTERPVACKTALEKPYASSTSDHLGSPNAERVEWSHSIHMFPATVHNMEAVFPIVRRIYEREPDDLVDDLDVNVATWGIFLNANPRSGVHLGQDCEANLRFVKNHF